MRLRIETVPRGQVRRWKDWHGMAGPLERCSGVHARRRGVGIERSPSLSAQPGRVLRGPVKCARQVVTSGRERGHHDTEEGRPSSVGWGRDGQCGVRAGPAGTSWGGGLVWQTREGVLTGAYERWGRRVLG